MMAEWTDLTLECLPADDEGNAVISPTGEPGDVYFTLIGCGPNETQNAIAARIVALWNAALAEQHGEGE